QVAGKPQTARTDVYAVGLLLYEMLTGRRFRTGDDTIALFRAILGGEVPAGDWGIPPRLEQLIRACVQPDPADRPSVDQVLLTLRDGGPLPSSARPEARPGATSAPSRPALRGAAIVVVVLVLMLIGLGVSWRTVPAGTAIPRLLMAIALAAAGI